MIADIRWMLRIAFVTSVVIIFGLLVYSAVNAQPVEVVSEQACIEVPAAEDTTITVNDRHFLCGTDVPGIETVLFPIEDGDPGENSLLWVVHPTVWGTPAAEPTPTPPILPMPGFDGNEGG